MVPCRRVQVHLEGADSDGVVPGDVAVEHRRIVQEYLHQHLVRTVGHVEGDGVLDQLLPVAVGEMDGAPLEHVRPGGLALGQDGALGLGALHLLKLSRVLWQALFLHHMIEGIADDIKIKLLAEIQEKFSVVDQNYSNVVTVHILRNNLDESDLPVLYENYREYDTDVQQEILAIAKENIDLITTNHQKVCRDIINELIKDATINNNNRIDLFVAIIEGITRAECKQYLEFLGLNEFVKIFEQNRRPKIPVNLVNQKILTALKRAGFVENFVEDVEEKMYKQIRRSSGKAELPKSCCNEWVQ